MSTTVSAPPAPFFRQHAATLKANGYDPIPLPFGQKGPNLPAWQRYKFDPADTSKHASDGVGILAARTPAIDVDVRDAAIARELDAIVRSLLRWPIDVPCKLSPIRIGLAPKMLRPCQVDGDSFKKKQTAGYRLPGDAADAKPHRVEILGDGQQFVGFNIHPDTKQPYTWTDGDPAQILHGWLPLLSAADADEIIKRCDQVLAKYGTPVGSASTAARAVDPLVAAIRKAGDTWFEPLSDEQKVAEARAIAATWTAEQATDRDSWFKCIRSIADAIDRGLDRETGIDIAAEFSERTTAANLASRDAIETKMFEDNIKSSIYAAAAIARKFGYKPPSNRLAPPPPAPDTMPTAPDGEPLPQARHLATDQRNAGRLIASYGKRLLSVGGILYAWSGRHWEPDTALAHRFAGNLSRLVAEEREQIEAQLKELEKSSDPNGTKIMMLKAIIKTLEMWGPECEMASRQNNAIKLLVKSVNIDADKLDADPLLINLENGTYNVRTSKLQPHNPLDYITKIAPVKFDAAATCSRFDQFLIEVYNGDEELIDFVLRWFGYCSTGETIEHHVVIHWGDGANGKGTLINTVAGILGDYAGAGAPGLLTAKNADSRHPAEIADLFGKRMVTCSETDQDAPLREGFIKQASGDDPLKGRFLYGQWFQFFPTHKLQAMTQHKPVVRGTDHGIWRRLLLIPYLNIFGTAKNIKDGKANKLMDVELGAALRAEWPGILNRVLQGAADWLHNRLSPPAVVLAASETYRREQDRIGEFVREELTLDINGRTDSKLLYGLYAGWDTGRTGAKPLGSKAFLAELEKHVPGFARARSNGVRWVHGVTIGQSPAPIPPPTFGP